MREEDSDLLVVGEIADDATVPVFCDSQRTQELARVGLRVPAVQVTELLFELAGPDAVLIAEVGLRVDGLFLGHDFVQAGVAHDHGL